MACIKCLYPNIFSYFLSFFGKESMLRRAWQADIPNLYKSFVIILTNLLVIFALIIILVLWAVQCGKGLNTVLTWPSHHTVPWPSIKPSPFFTFPTSLLLDTKLIWAEKKRHSKWQHIKFLSPVIHIWELQEKTKDQRSKMQHCMWSCGGRRLPTLYLCEKITKLEIFWQKRGKD